VSDRHCSRRPNTQPRFWLQYILGTVSDDPASIRYVVSFHSRRDSQTKLLSESQPTASPPSNTRKNGACFPYIQVFAPEPLSVIAPTHPLYRAPHIRIRIQRSAPLSQSLATGESSFISHSLSVRPIERSRNAKAIIIKLQCDELVV